MNLNTANLKVGLAASTDATRVNITTLHITQDGTEATNGHILARMSLPFQYDPEEVPALIKTDHAKELKPFLVPAKTMLGLKTFKSRRMPILDDTLFIDVAATNENGSAQFCMTDLETTATPLIKKTDMVFPDTNRVVPTNKPVKTVRFDANYMTTLLEIAKSAGATEIKMELPQRPREPIQLRSTNEATEQKFLGILMPLHDDPPLDEGRVRFNSVAYVPCSNEELDGLYSKLNPTLSDENHLVLSTPYLREQYAELAEENKNRIALLIDDVLAEIGNFDGDLWFYKN